VANLLYLQERAAQFARFQRQGLSRFLRFLESLREESDLGQPQMATRADDVVRIMSVHRSKGLEFPVVVLPDLGKRINLQDCTGTILVDRKAGLGMPVVDEHRRVRYPSLASVLVQNRLRQQALAEEMRVLYVAMTRAKEHLVLVGTTRAETPPRWAARWTGHDGPLPADVVLGAGSMLDWLGPVAAATAPPRGDVFRVTSYSAEDVLAWHHPSRRNPAWTDAQERMARLEPLDPPAPPHPVADAVIERLTHTYAYQEHTRVAAALAVTAEAVRTDGREGNGPAVALDALVLPGVQRPAGADAVGSATHRVFQHLDLARRCNREDVASQVAEMVERRLLDPAQASWVDLGAIEWFVSTEIGTLLRTHALALRRELPIYASVPPPGTDDAPLPPNSDPLDRVMLRGRLDVLLPLADRCVLVDYKTDAVEAHQVQRRLELHRPQLAAYADAVAAMTGSPVRAYAVFLRPQVVCEV
jgi:ATP-dependent helicase/nuclease subunit A